MELQRFEEEVKVTKKEMFKYLEYYTKKCLPALYSEHAKLENLLYGNDVAEYFKISSKQSPWFSLYSACI